MITSSTERIKALTEAGHWGAETLHGLLARHAGERPDALALKDQPNRDALTGHPPLALSWRELHHASVNLAAQLAARGVAPGDRLLVQLPNIVELAALYYTASRLGAVLSPVPVQYGRHELQLVASALAARTAISIPTLRGEPLAAPVVEALPGVEVLTFGSELSIDTGTPGDLESAPGDANSILSICWTSGTTGTPKGVPRSHNMWLATGRMAAEAGGMVAEDVLLNPFPLVNMAAIGGFLFPAALQGCALVLHHPLDPPLYLAQLQDERISFSIAPPALLNQLAQSPAQWQAFDFSALRRIGSGSAPLSPGMIATFDEDFGVAVVNFYGSNEGISLFATPETAADPAVRANRFPRPAPGAAIATRVVDPAGGEERSAAGEQGELLIAGATVFDGYFPAGDEAVFTDDGWFHSGDLVEICGEAGQYLRIVGRCKDIINRGGVKISPVELDLALEQHPDIAEAAVCAYHDDRLGEKICACVVPREGVAAPELAALSDYLLAQGFARFKLPERLLVLPQLPRNPLGKVQRFALQQQLDNGQA